MQDILLNTGNDTDLIIRNGDFAAGTSDEQQVQMLLISAPGEWKEHPEAGVGLYLGGHGTIDLFMERNIRVQLEADGFKISTLSITETGISLDGQYTTS